MIRQRFFIIILTLAALLGSLAIQAQAEILYARKGRVNNVGFGLASAWGGPLKTSPHSSPFEMPTGSGNYYTNDVWLMSMTVVRDLDNDGSPEDTSRNNKNSMSGYAGLNEARLAELAGSGLNMETATSERAGTDISQVWDSLDPETIDTWPWEAREPKGPTGEPVMKGAQTLVCHSGDTFNAWYNYPPPLGYYQNTSLYFLNFGESNNMVYGHVWMQNATHYFKYNDLLKDNYGTTLPDGHKWFEACMADNFRAPKFGGGDYLAWAFHPAKEIVAHYSKEPTISSFTPPEPPVLAWKMLVKPVHNEDVVKLTNINFWDHDQPFGFEGSRDFMTAYSISNQHRAMKGEEGGFDMFPTAVNPFLEPDEQRPLIGWPGMFRETDTRFNQWIWGGNSQNSYTMFGTLTDFEARDSCSYDFVIMVVPAEGKTIVRPELNLDQIDVAIMQDAFADVETYEASAREVFAGGLRSPETPSAPALTIIPGDREITIAWSDINAKTPDNFYYYLEDNGFNPDGYYKEYDFEGYRVYRSFVGPSDSHSELLEDFNISSGNLQFFYNDKQEEDDPWFRMQNGMKVWYAVVPYDKNYNPTTGEMFSLPDPEGGKQWNRPGNLEYNVSSRSEASNFKAAEMEGTITFTPAYGTPVYDAVVTVAGNGDGTFAEPPKYRAPVANLAFTPIINELITSEKTLTISPAVDSWKATRHAWGCYHNTMKFELYDGSTLASETGNYWLRRYTGRPGNITGAALGSPMTDAGPSYAVSADFMYMSDGNFRSEFHRVWNTGGYTGASPVLVNTHGSRVGAYPPNIIGQVRPGRLTITWGSGTITVEDVTRGYTLPFVEFPDQDYGWGFITMAAHGGTWSDAGQLWDDSQNDVAFSERTAKLVQSLPADNTEEFGIWLGGNYWSFQGTDGVIDGMPSAGTVMTLDNAYGSWNDDKTVFTQKREPPWPGDKWEIKVKPSTLLEEDINLSKIKVVPNPYLATSYLDLSPESRRIEFVNLPARCTIRIYTLGGNLVNVLNHIGANRQGWGDYTEWDRLTQSVPKEYTGYDNHGGTEPWNLRNRFGQTVASGLYFYHVTDTRGEKYTGKFYVVL
jgi:hypothetical protein